MERLYPTKGLNPKKYNLVRERDELIDALNRILPQYKIINYKRVCAFLSNCGVETDYFRTTEEYASGADYEGRKGLGNTQAGDGRRFKGRGLSQTTGRWNYSVLNKTVGKRLRIDFLKNPERLNEIDIAVESACIFWDEHNLNDYADRGAFKQLSGIVNRGNENLTPLHWAKRNELYSLCKRTLPQNFTLSESIEPPEAIKPAQDAPKQPETATNQPAPRAVEPSPSENPQNSEVENSDLLTNAISPDEVKTVSRSAGKRVWQFLVRPIGLLYAALEAGNVYAWAGVIVFTVAVGLTLYWHRADLKKLFAKLQVKIRNL